MWREKKKKKKERGTTEKCHLHRILTHEPKLYQLASVRDNIPGPGGADLTDARHEKVQDDGNYPV